MERDDPGGTSQTAARTDAQTLARGAGLSLAGTAFGTLLQFLAFLVVTHGLSTTEAGVFFESVALLTIAFGCTVFGADAGVVRQVAARRATGRPEDVRGTLISGLVPVAVASSVAALAIIALARPIAGWFFDPGLEDTAVASIRVGSLFIPPASVMVVALAGTRGFGGMREFVGIQNVLVPVLRLAGVALAVALGAGATGTLVGWGAAFVVGGALAVFVLMALERGLVVRRTSSTPLQSVARELWLFSGPRALGSVFAVLLSSLDILLVGALASTKAAAIYAAVSRLIGLGAYTLHAVGTALASQFSELIARDELERVGHIYRLSTGWMMAISWPLYMVFAVFAPVVMRMFGASYVEGSNALVILALAGLVDLATGNLVLLLLMTGRSLLNLANTVVVLALNVGLDLVLIPRYGVTGAAVGWAVSIVANNVIHMVQLRRIMALRPFGRGFWAVAFAAMLSFGVVGLAVRAILGPEPAALGCTLAIGSPLYAWMLWSSRDRLEVSLVVSAWLRRPAPSAGAAGTQGT